MPLEVYITFFVDSYILYLTVSALLVINHCNGNYCIEHPKWRILSAQFHQSRHISILPLEVRQQCHCAQFSVLHTSVRCRLREILHNLCTFWATSSVFMVTVAMVTKRSAFSESATQTFKLSKGSQ